MTALNPPAILAKRKSIINYLLNANFQALTKPPITKIGKAVGSIPVL
jgi:hypothetical protein